jgi:aldehyde dehydrogenase (NAD+)
MGKLLINGAWVDAVDGQTIEVVNPCDGQVFAKIARGQAADIDLAVSSARKALDGAWGRMTATERGRILHRLARLILDNAEEFAKLEARDTGKPMTVARNDAAAVARYFEFYGGAADKVHGQTIPYLNDYNVSVIRIPHGVTAHTSSPGITPLRCWAGPLHLR